MTANPLSAELAAELVALAHDLADAARKVTLAPFRQAALLAENKSALALIVTRSRSRGGSRHARHS